MARGLKFIALIGTETICLSWVITIQHLVEWK